MEQCPRSQWGRSCSSFIESGLGGGGFTGDTLSVIPYSRTTFVLRDSSLSSSRTISLLLNPAQSLPSRTFLLLLVIFAMRQTGYKVRETFPELKLKTPVFLSAVQGTKMRRRCQESRRRPFWWFTDPAVSGRDIGRTGSTYTPFCLVPRLGQVAGLSYVYLLVVSL